MFLIQNVCLVLKIVTNLCSLCLRCSAEFCCSFGFNLSLHVCSFPWKITFNFTGWIGFNTTPRMLEMWLTRGSHPDVRKPGNLQCMLPIFSGAAHSSWTMWILLGRSNGNLEKVVHKLFCWSFSSIWCFLSCLRYLPGSIQHFVEFNAEQVAKEALFFLHWVTCWDRVCSRSRGSGSPTNFSKSQLVMMHNHKSNGGHNECLEEADPKIRCRGLLL